MTYRTRGRPAGKTGPAPVLRPDEITMRTRLAHPHLGGQPMGGIAPEDAWPVFAEDIGYVLHIDVGALEDCAKIADRTVFITALPGVFADPARPIAKVSGPRDKAVHKAVGEAFSVGPERTFDQDPRFGLCVLAEIASRALSPAVNDPGTAIDVIGRAVRLLAQWGRYASEIEVETQYPHVWVPAVDVGDMFDDIFAPIERDGASLIEIHLRLQKAFAAFVAADRDTLGDAARRHSVSALERAETGLAQEGERRAVRDLAMKLFQDGGGASRTGDQQL